MQSLLCLDIEVDQIITVEKTVKPQIEFETKACGKDNKYSLNLLKNLASY